jgi:two-component system phosphate regulon sensor histidine kinase PhoR
MTRRIFWSICLVAIVVLVASMTLNLSVVYDYFTKSQLNQLEMQTRLAGQGVLADGLEYLTALPDSQNRVTWIAADGSVLFDTENQTGSMDNHLEREEIREALENGAGQSIRLSETMQAESLYYAIRLEDGTVIRLSTNQQSRRSLLVSMLRPLGAVILIMLVISAVLAFQLSRKLVQPLNTLDLDHPMDCEAYEELSPFLERIHSQQTQLKQQEAQ